MEMKPIRIEDLDTEKRKAVMERSMEDISSIYEYVREIVNGRDIAFDAGSWPKTVICRLMMGRNLNCPGRRKPVFFPVGLLVDFCPAALGPDNYGPGRVAPSGRLCRQCRIRPAKRDQEDY